MKISLNTQDINISFSQTNNPERNPQASNKGENGSISASQLNLNQDSILERKRKAMADAMNIVGKQFEADAKIDDNLKERRNRIADSKGRANSALKEMNALTAEQEKVKEAYGIRDDSQEQQDLELRIKIEKAMDPTTNAKLTQEDLERMKELGPITEYQQQMLDLESAKGVWEKEINEAQKIIRDETQIIRATKQELLKYHGMVDATKAAEASLEAASKEIIGMIMEEGQEHIQEEIEEAVEQGQELKEEKEEQEAIRKEQKTKEEEMQAQLQDMGDVSNLEEEVERQLKEILEKQKLLEEDLKGVQVDNII